MSDQHVPALRRRFLENIGPEEYQTQISIAGNHSRFAVRDDSINQVVRISENEVNPKTLGKYLDENELSVY